MPPACLLAQDPEGLAHLRDALRDCVEDGCAAFNVAPDHLGVAVEVDPRDGNGVMQVAHLCGEGAAAKQVGGPEERADHASAADESVDGVARGLADHRGGGVDRAAEEQPDIGARRGPPLHREALGA